MTADYGPSILARHAGLLATAAISPQVARAAGIRSAARPSEFPQEFRSLADAAVPALVFPWHRINGDDPLPQIRPDRPVRRPDGSEAKYLFPNRAKPVLWVHPDMRDRVRDATAPILIVEGTKQYLAAVSALDGKPHAAVGISGCYGWCSDGVPIPDLRDVPWARDAFVCFDADVESNRGVWEAADKLTEVLGALGVAATRYIKVPGLGSAGFDDVLGATADPRDALSRIIERARGKLPRKPAAKRRQGEAAQPHGAGLAESAESAVPVFDGTLTGAQVLDRVQAFISPYLVLPSPHCLTVLVLWAAHTFAAHQFYVTPRLIVDSAERSSGKSRVLELLVLITYKPKATISITTAALYRRLAKAGKRPLTVLFDETDAIFNPRTAPQYEDLRALLDAGYKRGATVDRCVGEGSGLDVMEFPVFAPVALAGLAGHMPATISTRAAAEIHMRKRSPQEKVQPYYEEDAAPAAAPIRELLAGWVESVSGSLGSARPEMPDGVVDRPAENWRSLLSIADAAGGDWPEQARAACRWFVLGTEHKESFGVRLLRDLRHAFTVFAEIPGENEDDEPTRIPQSFTDRLPTTDILKALIEGIEDSPWADLRGKPLDSVKLADELRRYDVEKKTVRIPDQNKPGKTKPAKGYYVAGEGGLGDAWSRYLTDHPTYLGGGGDSGDSTGQRVAAPAPVTSLPVTGEHAHPGENPAVTSRAVAADQPVTAPTCTVTGVTAVTAPSARVGAEAGPRMAGAEAGADAPSFLNGHRTNPDGDDGFTLVAQAEDETDWSA